MLNNKLYLSESSTMMLNEMLMEVREYNFHTVNFPIFLECLLSAEIENGDNPLDSYLLLQKIDEETTEDVLSEMILDMLNESSIHSGINQEEDFTIATELVFKDSENTNFSILVDDDVAKVYAELLKLVNQFNISEIDIIHFTIAMFMAEIKQFKDFFEKIKFSYNKAKKYFSPEKFLQVDSFIPRELSSFLDILNNKVDPSMPCEILMRDDETESLWNIMLKKNKRNAIIVGEAGVGKTALVEKITYDINTKKCPKEFINFKVISLDINALIAGTSFRGDAEERIMQLIDFLKENHDVILFIDEVHTILGAGSCHEGEMDLANALKPILARGDTIVIGSTTVNEYQKYFQKDAALSRRFERINVSEPMSKEVYYMIKNKLKALSQFHGVKIQKRIVEYAIMIASCFAFDKKNPDKTLDLIDRAMVSAKRAGKEYVDKEAILKNFDIYFKKWNNMDIDSRKEVAYHEAGHYIVGKASGRLISHNWLAVSIMPAEEYLGVTVYEIDDTKMPFLNIDYYIDNIACDLAGRVAENIFRNSYTSGASIDLSKATETAFNVVTKLGMGSDAIKNRIYLNTQEFPMFSEKSTDTINDEVNKLIDKAFQRASELLRENNDILEAIVKALLEKHIMSEAELDKIWKKVVNKRNS